MVPYLAAAGIALVVSVIEQYRLGAQFTLRNQAARWWALRIVGEVAVVVLAVGICRATRVAHAGEWWFGVAVGFAGPTALRLRLFDYGRGEESTAIGPAGIYEAGRAIVEKKIDQRSSERQALWITFDLLPRLERRNVEPDQLGQIVIDYLRGLPDVETRDKEIKYIHDALHDSSTSSAAKRELLARHAALELGAYHLLQVFLQRAGPDV